MMGNTDDGQYADDDVHSTDDQQQHGRWAIRMMMMWATLMMMGSWEIPRWETLTTMSNAGVGKYIPMLMGNTDNDGQ